MQPSRPPPGDFGAARRPHHGCGRRRPPRWLDWAAVLALSAALGWTIGSRLAEPPAIDGALDRSDCPDMDGFRELGGTEPPGWPSPIDAAVALAREASNGRGQRLVVHPDGTWTMLNAQEREMYRVSAFEVSTGWAAEVACP